MPDVTNILHEAKRILEQLGNVKPTHWKGNDAPQTHHFDPGSIVVDGGAILTPPSYWVRAKYTDGGTPHVLYAKIPVGSSEPQEITYDGVAMTDDRFSTGYRMGWENGPYHRLIIEFKGTDAANVHHDYRFDGDLPL